MIKKVLFIFLITIPLSTFSQRFDGIIFFGMSASQVDRDQYGGYHKIGLNAGLNVTHEISEKIEFQTGINYIDKGAASGSKYSDYKLKLNYFQIPVQLNIDFYKRISLSGGIFFGYLINGKANYDISYYNIKNREICSYFSINYHYFEKLVLNFGFSYSIFPITTDHPYYFNNVVTITGTYRMSNAKK
jgi:hypothetical protein